MHHRLENERVRRRHRHRRSKALDSSINERLLIPAVMAIIIVAIGAAIWGSAMYKRFFRGDPSNMWIDVASNWIKIANTGRTDWNSGFVILNGEYQTNFGWFPLNTTMKIPYGHFRRGGGEIFNRTNTPVLKVEVRPEGFPPREIVRQN
jgi:hypothetical protein